MPRDPELFIAIAIFELAAIFALFQYTLRFWLRVAGAFLTAVIAAIARNIYYGTGVNRETTTMSLIHSATVTIIFSLIFLVRWKRGRDR
jgi:hypothetical protein